MIDASLMTRLKPTGFWSYTSQDDSSSRGRLSQLRRVLADEVQQMVGRTPEVHIFQDVAAIPPGAGWEKQIQEAIKEASFFIPIVTPGFLQSEWCCREVMHFHQREIGLGRSDLIFPIYYNDIGDFKTFRRPEIHDPDVLRLLLERQWLNFRDLRHRNPDSEEVATRFEDLANGIRRALFRPVEAGPPPGSGLFPPSQAPRLSAPFGLWRRNAPSRRRAPGSSPETRRTFRESQLAKARACQVRASRLTKQPAPFRDPNRGRRRTLWRGGEPRLTRRRRDRKRSPHDRRTHPASSSHRP